MSVVFSPWYFVLILLVAAIVASIVVFIRMDKKDRILIEEFVKNSTEEKKVENSAPVKDEIDQKKE